MAELHEWDRKEMKNVKKFESKERLETKTTDPGCVKTYALNTE